MSVAFTLSLRLLHGKQSFEGRPLLTMIGQYQRTDKLAQRVLVTLECGFVRIVLVAQSCVSKNLRGCLRKSLRRTLEQERVCSY